MASSQPTFRPLHIQRFAGSLRHFPRGIAAAAVVVAGIILSGCGAPRLSITKATATPARDSMRALEYFVEGSMHDLRGEYSEAVIEYEEALRYDDAAPIHYAIAKDCYELHKTPRAARYADAAIERDSTNPLYRQLRARIAMNLQMDFAEAQRQFEAIVALDSNDTQTLSDLATLYQYRGQPRRAIALFRRLMSIIGTDGDIGLRMADLYSDLGEPANAVAVLKECMIDDPDDATLSQTLAQTFLKMKQRDSAIAVYQDILARFPDDASSRRVLGDIYSSSGQWPLAFAQYRMVCEDSSVEMDTLNLVLDSLYTHLRSDSTVLDSVFALISDVAESDSTNWYPDVLCGGAALYGRDVAASREWMDEAMSITHDSASTLVAISQMYFDHGNLDDVLRVTADVARYRDFRLPMMRAFALIRMQRRVEAATSLYQSLELNPRNWLALSELAASLEEQKQYRAADSAYEAAILLKPDYATALNNYSYSLAERGMQLDRAQMMSQQALEQEPDNVNYLDTYGWIEFRMAKLDSAAAYLARAVSDKNATSAVFEHYGDVQYQRGRQDEAVRLYQRALELDDRNDALRQKIRERSIAR